MRENHILGKEFKILQRGEKTPSIHVPKFPQGKKSKISETFQNLKSLRHRRKTKLVELYGGGPNYQKSSRTTCSLFFLKNLR
jgi:hypothetical protein